MNIKQLARCIFLSTAMLAAPAHAAYIDAAGNCRHGSAFKLSLGSSASGSCEPSIAPTSLSGIVSQHVIVQGFDGAGYQFAVLAITAFNMEGTHPDLGHLTIALDRSRPGVSASLRGTVPGPDAPVVHRTFINVVATAENLPGVVLQNQGPPIEFQSEPTSVWPGPVTTYSTPVEISFEDRTNPGAVVMTACPGYVTVYGQGSAVACPGVSLGGAVALAISMCLAGIATMVGRLRRLRVRDVRIEL